MIQDVFSYLNVIQDPMLVIVDVGCYGGAFKNLVEPLISKPSFWVGIDPIDAGLAQYNIRIKKAITNIKEEAVVNFYDYKYRQCSSLLPMNIEIVTYDPEEWNTKWLAPWPIEELNEIYGVVACSLKHALKDIPETDMIHFLKIDTQGMDIHVVESLGEKLNNTYFIQLECVATHNPEIVLYKGQTIMEYDVLKMKEFGFEIFSAEYATSSPEADVIFYNKNLVKI